MELKMQKNVRKFKHAATIIICPWISTLWCLLTYPCLTKTDCLTESIKPHINGLSLLNHPILTATNPRLLASQLQLEQQWCFRISSEVEHFYMQQCTDIYTAIILTLYLCLLAFLDTVVFIHYKTTKLCNVEIQSRQTGRRVYLSEPVLSLCLSLPRLLLLTYIQTCIP